MYKPTSVRIAGMDYAVDWLTLSDMREETKEVNILKERICLLQGLSPEAAWVLLWEGVLEVLSSTQG